MCILASIPILNLFRRMLVFLFVYFCMTVCCASLLLHRRRSSCSSCGKCGSRGNIFASHIYNRCCCCRQPALSIDVCQFVAQNLHLYLFILLFLLLYFFLLHRLSSIVYVSISVVLALEFLCMTRMLTFYSRISFFARRFILILFSCVYTNVRIACMCESMSECFAKIH